MLKMGKMKTGVCIAILFIFMDTYGFAVNYDPAQYITKQTHLLRDNESVGNIKQIELNNQQYYVLQIVTNNTTTGYIALYRFEKKRFQELLNPNNFFKQCSFLCYIRNLKSE